MSGDYRPFGRRNQDGPRRGLFHEWQGRIRVLAFAASGPQPGRTACHRSGINQTFLGVLLP